MSRFFIRPLPGAIVIALIAVNAGGIAQAGPGPAPQWCARAYDGATDCSYFTYQQCHWAVWGTGGDCAVNPRFAGYPDRPYRRARRVYR